jgi:arsenate reductase
MTDSFYNVLFLCTGNSARSIIAESLLNHHGAGRFKAYSAGSHPTGQVNPYAIDLLRSLDLPIEGARSKSWDEFAQAGAPQMDFVFTVCGQAAGEVCPIWPGQPISAHWGVDDPAAIIGSEIEKHRAFRTALRVLDNRIKLFTNLRLDELDNMAIKRKIDQIGTARPDDAPGRDAAASHANPASA